MKQIYLIVSTECNLHCTYCYAKGSNYHQGPPLLNKKTAEQTVNWFFQWLGKSKQGNIIFFGGEPLLNWDIILFVVKLSKKRAKARNKEIFFSITSNGTLFNKINVAFLRKHNFSILISCDSHKQEINDKIRPSRDKKSTFKKIIKGLKLLKAKDNVGIRPTISPDNSDLVGFCKYFSKFKTIKYINFAPDCLSGARNKFNYYNKALNKYLDYVLKNWNKENIVSPDAFRTFMARMRHINKIKSPCTNCGSGTDTLCVSQSGKIYYCTHFTGMKDFYLGNVFQGIDLSLKKKILSKTSFKKKKKCQACSVRYICGGGCNAVNHSLSGRVDTPIREYCKVVKHQIACSQKINDKIDALLAT